MEKVFASKVVNSAEYHDVFDRLCAAGWSMVFPAPCEKNNQLLAVAKRNNDSLQIFHDFQYGVGADFINYVYAQLGQDGNVVMSYTIGSMVDNEVLWR